MNDAGMAFVLEQFPPDYVGYCLEAGACDGIFLSTTLNLEQSGWECLCIEPNPYYFEKLVGNRRLCMNYALGDHSEEGHDFEIFWNEESDQASLSCLNRDEALYRGFIATLQPLDVIKVSVRTLDACLSEAQFPRLDFLSLDLEGGELTALMGYDFERWSAKVMRIENHYERDELRTLMATHGYRLAHRIEVDDYYVR